MNILVSACLLGAQCRYDGGGKACGEVLKLREHHHLVPVCPEQLGGLATPRDPAERSGELVLTKSGRDVTAQYAKGAREALKLAKLLDCRWAVLKERSPSCGCKVIYDGSFTGKTVPGDGVAAALLREAGIPVLGESGALLLYNTSFREENRMNTAVEREKALDLLMKYNREPFHLLHALTVEGVMRWYAKELGFGEEKDFWGIAGLLHDVDFERYPEEHCQKAPELLAEIGAEAELVRAVCSHGYGLVSEVKPEHQMEKVMFAADELTGLIGAAVKMRPSKSAADLEVSSLKKKFKDKRFAAGCSRDVIAKGAEELGWTLEELFEKTILAMRSCEEKVGEELERLTKHLTSPDN